MDGCRTTDGQPCYGPRILVVRPRTSRMRSLWPVQRSADRPTSKENHPMQLAYLDAASGSMIVQAIVAGVAGVAVFAKLFWRRLTSPFRRKKSLAKTATPATPAAGRQGRQALSRRPQPPV